jgi:hypothetical protein
MLEALGGSQSRATGLSGSAPLPIYATTPGE